MSRSYRKTKPPTRPVSLRLSLDEVRLFREEARRRGKSFNGWARDCLRRFAGVAECLDDYTSTAECSSSGPKKGKR